MSSSIKTTWLEQRKWLVVGFSVAILGAIVALIASWLGTRQTESKVRRTLRGTFEAVRCAVDEHVDIASPVLPSFDGVPLAKGDRILLLAQDHAIQNGIYVVKVNGRGEKSVKRADDLKQDKHAVVGAMVMVREGRKHGGTTYVLQIQAGDGSRSGGISQGLQFVRLSDHLLGDFNREDGAVLVSDSLSPTGVSWKMERGAESSEPLEILHESDDVRLPPDTSVDVRLDVVLLPSAPGTNFTLLTRCDDGAVSLGEYVCGGKSAEHILLRHTVFGAEENLYVDVIDGKTLKMENESEYERKVTRATVHI